VCDMQENAVNGDSKPSQSEPSLPTLCLHVSSFKAVVSALNHPTYYNRWIRMPTASTFPPQSLVDDKRFDPWFKNCLGAIDGTFIPAHVPCLDHARYRTRKKTLSSTCLPAVPLICDSARFTPVERVAQTIIESIRKRLLRTSGSLKDASTWLMLDNRPLEPCSHHTEVSDTI